MSTGASAFCVSIRRFAAAVQALEPCLARAGVRWRVPQRRGGRDSKVAQWIERNTAVGLLIVDGEYVRTLGPGVHAYWTGQYENTLIFVMADNGPEGCNNSYENMGNADSYLWYGQNWAQAGNTPRRMYKGDTSQGGVNVPAFAWFPRAFPGGRVDDEVASVMDVMPTLLEAAGVPHPGSQYRGRAVKPMQGRSLLPLFEGRTDDIGGEDYWIGWELFGKRAIRKGDWKLVYLPGHELRSVPAQIRTDTWQLYNLATDPRELEDLSAQEPEKLQELLALWKEYERSNGVILPGKIEAY